ncbi:MAG: hypothetical protein AAGD35_04300 [Actinomycetota bacterium]
MGWHRDRSALTAACLVFVVGACSASSWTVDDAVATEAPVGSASVRAAGDGHAITIVLATDTGGDARCAPPRVVEVAIEHLGPADGPPDRVHVSTRWPRRGCADQGAVARTITLDPVMTTDPVAVVFSPSPEPADTCVMVEFDPAAVVDDEADASFVVGVPSDC